MVVIVTVDAGTVVGDVTVETAVTAPACTVLTAVSCRRHLGKIDVPGFGNRSETARGRRFTEDRSTVCLDVSVDISVGPKSEIQRVHFAFNLLSLEKRRSSCRSQKRDKNEPGGWINE